LIVLDASAAICLLDAGEAGDRVAHVLEAAQTIHAPELLLVECASALRRRMSRGEVSADQARLCMEALQETGLTLHSHAPLMSVVFDMASRITAYDAAYVALARALDARLVTLDGLLARAATTWCDVELIA
jgi:predicted nucleic acid-binding protein